MLEQLTERARHFYIRLNQRTNGWLAALARAFSRFSQNRATETAAGISFYAIFSFFPLLVFLVMATSSLLAQPAIQEILRKFLATAFPISLEPLLDEVNAMLQTNDSLNLIALIGFMWAASSVFNAFMVGVNRAWGRSDIRSMIKSRLVALALVTSFAIVLVVFMYLLYRWGPVTRSPTHKKAALLGAIITGLALEITNAIYTWYLQSGWSSYDVIYGSLGAIIGLLFWVYVSSLILLFGAYLAEAIDFRLKHDAHMELPEIFPAKAE
jgi:membrane protein